MLAQMLRYGLFLNGKLVALSPPNTACTRLGVRAAFFDIFLARGGFRFGGDSTLPPQAGNASRWAAEGKCTKIARQSGSLAPVVTHSTHRGV